MKHTVFLLLIGLCFQPAFSQEANHVNGGPFSKTVEYNTSSSIVTVDENGNESPGYNMDGKSRLEKLFFGDFNAPVEFFCSPPFAGASGIRLVRDLSSDAPYILEVKYITNWLEIMKELEEKYPSRGITVGDIYSMPAEEQEQIAQHNRAMFQKIREERLDLCDIRTLTFPLYHLGDSLYAKMVALIANFRAEGGFDTFADGTTVIFRCVVGDELWSLRIREPQKSAMQLSDLCLKIIEDAENGKLNETEYLKLLSKSPRPYSGTAFLGQ